MTIDQVLYSKRMFLVMIVYLIASYLNQSFDGFLLGVENYHYSKSVSILRTIIRTLSLIIVIHNIRSAICIAYIDCILAVIILVISGGYCYRRYMVKLSLKEFDTAIFKQSIPMCLALLLQTIINQANSSVDKFVIGVMIDVESVSLYSVSQYIFTMFSSMVTIPVSMFLPEVSKNISNGLKEKKLTDTLIAPCRLTVIIGGTLLFGFIAVGRQFIVILYGEDKILAWTYALIIMIPMFINMTDAVIIDVLDVLNKRLTRSLALLGTTIANIVLTVVLIQAYGIIGAVTATAVTMILGNIIVMNIYYKRKLGIEVVYLFAKAYKGLLPFMIISSIITSVVASLINIPFVSFACGGILYVIISTSLIYLFGLNDYEKQRITDVFRRLQSK